MQDILVQSLNKLKRVRIKRTRMMAVLLVLSLLVSLEVFWTLRKPGLTLAGDADCGIVEHIHDEDCLNAETPCRLEEHTHTTYCYSDESKDVETTLEWETMFKNYPYTGDLNKDLVGIAKTQVGYCESKLNFTIDENKVRHGYTRYGAWYGAPYGDWSAMFVSFCLHYTGADESKYPINTGANSMAIQWENLGKYMPAGGYTPISGDLVFFKDNTVGIVAEVQTSSFVLICGDIDDAVVSKTMVITDNSIKGWGLTSKTVSNKELLNISNGPAFFIFADNAVGTKVQTYNLRNARSAYNMAEYLNSVGGTYYVTLLDANNHAVPKDEHGNYMVQANTKYKITFTANSPKGFNSGTYIYTLPTGVRIDGGIGDFDLNGEIVGDWEVTNDGLITLNLYPSITELTNVTISSSMGIYFPQQEEPIAFGDKIVVAVQKPQVETYETEITKWGEQGDPENIHDTQKFAKTDTSKLYWTVQVVGDKNSNIPGSKLTDQIVKQEGTYEHRYTESDIANGLTFGASWVDPNTNDEGSWHKWTVYADGINLIWNENGWEYTMPKTVTCQICGNTINLGNENWTYYVEYTSTPEKTNIAGSLPYANYFTVDNHGKDGWGEFTQTEVKSEILKTGKFVSDAEGGKYVWEIKVTAPGKKAETDYEWTFTDHLAVVDQNNNVKAYLSNDLNVDNVTVTANYHGTTINVPFVAYATENDPYAYQLFSWKEGEKDVRQMIFLVRCTCDTEPCGHASDICWKESYWVGSQQLLSDYCRCWSETEDTTFTVLYETQNIAEIEKYSGLGYSLRNYVTLKSADTTYKNSWALVKIPDIISKVLTQEIKNYIAKYSITVNEGKMVLTDGKPFVIIDEMTDSLAFIVGSLSITAEDEIGRITHLEKEIDYEIEYDGSGGQTDEQGNKIHVLKITILHPQPVKYVLDYDTMVQVQPGAVPPIMYKNNATVTVWGEEFSNDSTEKFFADINISANTYGVDIVKKAADTGETLKGAKFGLFNERGVIITYGEETEDGKIEFRTDVEAGIILMEHELYYIQEIEAPPGYKLDTTKHWICFCNKSDGTCETFKELVKDLDLDLVRVRVDEIVEMELTNEVLNYNLPATGGPGTYYLILAGAILVAVPLVYIFIRRRKRERRGVG